MRGLPQSVTFTACSKYFKYKIHILNGLCVFNISLASNEKENTQPFVVLPKEYPVYLWQPFLRHAYFCFHEALDQKKFSGLLSDCIRHLNHGMARQPS